MHFSEATDAPIILDTGSRKIAVPRFGLKDFSLWAAELDAERREQFDKGIAEMPEPKDRFHFRNTYRIFPTDIDTCMIYVRSPAGTQRVIDTCLARARTVERDGQRVDEPLAPEEVAALKEANQDQLPELANLLAGARPQPKAGTNGDGKGEGTGDPLARGGTASASAPPAIGTPQSAPT